VRVSAFSVVDAFPAGLEAGRDRYGELRAVAKAADRAGLDTFWLAEHHFHPGGLCPSPPVLLAAIGAETTRLRLGVMVSVLPFHDPVDLAEQYALLDQLVDGRLRLGVGSGYIAEEFAGFGLDPAERRARFDRHLETLRSALAGAPVTVGAPGATPVTINVRPRQPQGPEFIVAAQRRESVLALGGRGLSVALIPYATVPDLPALAEEIAAYRAALPAGADARVLAAVHVYVGGRPGVARRALQRYLDARRATGSLHYNAKVAADPAAMRAETIESSGLALIGSSDQVREGLERFRRAGVDELLGIFDFGGLPVSASRSSIAAVARIVAASSPAAAPAAASPS
jgi:alkanesulfonate monooxygenase SsuD/methylene tetrahydromethanopterin reductase-like flavin-dependent oxidoreductase (luciferase family)